MLPLLLIRIKKKGAIVPRSISEATDEMDFQLLGPGPPRDKLVSKPCKVRSETESQAPFFFSLTAYHTYRLLPVCLCMERCHDARQLGILRGSFNLGPLWISSLAALRLSILCLHLQSRRGLREGKRRSSEARSSLVEISPFQCIN
jgi:hypothetical protein